MKKLLLALTAAFAVVALTAAAASAAPHVVVWSGELIPGTPANGVELLPDGTGRVVSADGGGRIHVRGSLAAHGRILSQIQAAADKVLHSAPLVTHAAGQDGGYVSVVVQDGAHRKAVTETGVDSPVVAQLLNRLNAALAPGHGTARAAGPRSAAEALAAMKARTPPTTAACPQGQQPTEVEKDVPLEDAAAAGIVTDLQPKGTLGGDAIAVDAQSKPISAPAKITVHIEVSSDPGDPTDWVPKLQASLSAAYANFTVDEHQVKFDFDIVNRAPGAAPRPCYHEIAMHQTNLVRSYVEGSTAGPDVGEWSDAQSASWPHETGHLLGFGDRYDDYFHVNATGVDIKLPQNGLAADELQEALGSDIKLTDGYLVHKVWKGHENDLMGRSRVGRMSQDDVNSLVAGASLVLTANPGDILVNKRTGEQNLVVGAPFSMPVPVNGSAHRDGIVAYCIDTAKDTPGESGPTAGFDVLGRAGDMGTPAMSALQRVVDVVAARQPGPLQATPGATNAIWRVSDDFPVSASDTAANGILAAAGVSPTADTGVTYAAPHFTDPAAGIARPVALSSPTGGPLPAPPAPRQGVVPTRARLTGLTVGPRRVRLQRGRARAVIAVRVTLAGLGDRVTLSLTHRHGHRTVTLMRTHAHTFQAGQTLLDLAVRRLKPGTYKLLARGAHSGQRHTTVVVTRARRR